MSTATGSVCMACFAAGFGCSCLFPGVDDRVHFDGTIEDPRVVSRPWKMRMPRYRRIEPNIQRLDYECQAYLEAAKDCGR